MKLVSFSLVIHLPQSEIAKINLNPPFLSNLRLSCSYYTQLKQSYWMKEKQGQIRN